MTPPKAQNSAGKKAKRQLRLGFMLRAAHRLYASHLQQRLVRFDISLPEYQHLYMLYHWGSLSPGEMTARLELTKAAATAVLKSLSNKHLVTSSSNAMDSRRLDVELTLKGRKLMEELTRSADEIYSTATTGFTLAESKQIIGLLSRLIDNLHDYADQMEKAWHAAE